MAEPDQAVRTGYPRPRTAIERMAPYVPPTAGRLGKLRLDFNENTVGCSLRVVSALQRLAAQDLLPTYPEYQEARQSVGKFFGVPGEQMLFTDGTDEAIHLLCSTYVEPGEEVVVPWPTFPMYRFYAEVAAAIPRLVPYRAPNLEFPLEELLAAIGPRTRLILIANPNSPTGGAIGLAEIEKIVAKARDTAVLIDEAYFEFFGLTALDLLSKYPNLFVSRTFSKTYGLAGLRVGCLFSQEQNIATVHKGQSPYSVNSIGVVCVGEALADQQYVQDYVREVLEARDELLAGLTGLGLKHYPTQANFVLVRFEEHAAAVCEQLKQRGILVRDRSRELPGTVRITVGTKGQTIRLLEALREVWGRVTSGQPA